MAIEIPVALREEQFRMSKLNNLDYTVRPIIRTDIKEWLQANAKGWGWQIAYSIAVDLSDIAFNFERKAQAWIIFDDPGKAILFKLTWR